MGFYPQPNQWLCGPFALKFGFLVLGIFEEEDVIARAAGTDEDGTDETELARAAARFGCELLMLRQTDPAAARRDLDAYLRRGLPVLVCINEWNHWVTVVRAEAGDYVVLDSHDAGVVRVLPWDALRKVWGFRDRERAVTRVLYDLHPLVPRRPSRGRAALSPERARYLARPENRPFARVWGAIARDLLDLAIPREAQLTWSVRMDSLIHRENDLILDQLDYETGSVDRATARRLLDQLEFAADTYDLELPPEDEPRVVAGIGAILARWAAGGYRAPAPAARRSEVA